MFHEDKALPSSKLIDYFEGSIVGDLYIFFFFLLEADAHDNLLVPVQECIFSHCPSQDKSHIGKI